MHRLVMSLGAIALVFGFAATPSASAQQSASFYVGAFTPRSIDARDSNDVLVQNSVFLSTQNQLRGIDIGEFNNVTVGGEWLFGFSRVLEGGLGAGFYQDTVPTLYTDLVNTNGTDIEQDLKLRIVPFTGTIRFLPLGNRARVQPYIGAGVGVYYWRYSETGQFVDFQNNVFTGNFVGSGGAVGPVIMGGVRAPIGQSSVGFEIRYQSAEGELPNDQGFAGSKIDLGGFNYVFTTSFRF
jgi:outer membrane protein W